MPALATRMSGGLSWSSVAASALADRLFAGDVDLDGDGVAQGSGGLLGAVDVAVPQRHAAAAAGDLGRAGKADAARAAGHDGRAILEQRRLHGCLPNP